MRNLVYIKVHKGFIEARTCGENNEKKYYSSGLNHPRSLADDFIEVEKAFKSALSEQPKKWLGLITPKVLVHLVPKMEGGYTPAERRFFREAALGGGAKEVYMVTDNLPPLKDNEIYERHNEL
jgi:hypothetical protein